MKELHTGHLYWPETVGSTLEQPALKQNIKTDVAVIGGGMSGTICSHVFVQSGLTVAMLERGQIAGGSTSANTGMLQFCNDIMLCDLIDQIGQSDAVAFYRACKHAVDRIESTASLLDIDVGFNRKSSLYYASSEQDLPKLREEYETLHSYGFDVEYWDADKIAKHFPFRKPGAIVTHGDAAINPYRFVSTLAKHAVDAGLMAYEQTDIVEHRTLDDGYHVLRTADGFEVEAKHVVYAIGYEPEELRGKLIKASLKRSFVIVTGTQPDLTDWHEHFFIWETGRPYLYMRTDNYNRAFVGGMDEDVEKPLHDALAQRKHSEKLYERLRSLFPMFEAPIEYEWNATFGESRDNLPFIGEDPAWPNVYYCLGYGGNGSVYSMIAADLLRDLIKGVPNGLAPIVALDRQSLSQDQ